MWLNWFNIELFIITIIICATACRNSEERDQVAMINHTKTSDALSEAKCDTDSIYVRKLVQESYARFGNITLMDRDLNFYDSYSESVFPNSEIVNYRLYDTIFMPGNFNSIELKFVLKNYMTPTQMEIVNQHYNTREKLLRSYKTTYKIDSNSIIAHVVAPDLRRAKNNQRTIYLTFGDGDCEYDVPIILKQKL